jgi:hypothetical protein
MTLEETPIIEAPVVAKQLAPRKLQVTRLSSEMAIELSRQLPLRAIDAVPLAVTFPAVARSVFLDVGVSGIKGMAVNAVSFVSVPNPALPVIALAFTLPADPFPRSVDMGVGSIIGMTLRAVFSLAPVVYAPANILRHRDWFQVCRVYAPAVSAQVIELQAFRNSTDEVFVHQPMRLVGLISPDTTAVSLAGRANPKPALARLSIGDVFCDKIVNRLVAVDRIGFRHSGNSSFPDCRADGCLPHPSAHSFNHEY